MNDLVAYNNDINKLSFKGFTKSNMDIFMAICSKMKDKSTQEVIFSFAELLELSGVKPKNKDELISMIRTTKDRLFKVNCEIITNEREIYFVLFPTFEIDKVNEFLKVAVNPSFTWLLNELKQYTIFELAEFTKLKSKYSKNLYRLLKQWRTIGKYTFHSIDEFKELLDVPASYEIRDIREKIIKPAIADIKELDGSFKGLNYKIIRSSKRGTATKGYTFTWQKESKECIDLSVNESTLDPDFVRRVNERAEELNRKRGGH